MPGNLQPLYRGHRNWAESHFNRNPASNVYAGPTYASFIGDYIFNGPRSSQHPNLDRALHTLQGGINSHAAYYPFATSDYQQVQQAPHRSAGQQGFPALEPRPDPALAVDIPNQSHQGWIKINGLFDNPFVQTKVHGSQEALELLRHSIEAEDFMVPDDIPTPTQLNVFLASQLGVSLAQFAAVHQFSLSHHVDLPLFDGVPIPFNALAFDLNSLLRVIKLTRGLTDRTRVARVLIFTQDYEDRYHVQLISLWNDMPATHTVKLGRVITIQDDSFIREEWFTLEPRPLVPPTAPQSTDKGKGKAKAEKPKPKRQAAKRFSGMMQTKVKFNNYHLLSADHLMSENCTVPSAHYMGETLLRIGEKYRTRDIRKRINQIEKEEGAKKLISGAGITQRLRHALRARAKRTGQDAAQVSRTYYKYKYDDDNTPREKNRTKSIGKAPVHRTPRARKAVKTRGPGQVTTVPRNGQAVEGGSTAIAVRKAAPLPEDVSAADNEYEDTDGNDAENEDTETESAEEEVTDSESDEEVEAGNDDDEGET